MIAKEDMSILISAQEAKAQAATALDDIEEMTIAYAINNAANTGEARLKYTGYMSPYIISKLKGLGYTVESVTSKDGVEVPNLHIISFG
jgi:hypothetical protein